MDFQPSHKARSSVFMWKLGKLRQEELCSLISQPSQIYELLGQRETMSQKTRWITVKRDTQHEPLAPTWVYEHMRVQAHLHILIQRYTYIHTHHIHAHTDTHTCTRNLRLKNFPRKTVVQPRSWEPIASLNVYSPHSFSTALTSEPWTLRLGTS